MGGQGRRADPVYPAFVYPCLKYRISTIPDLHKKCSPVETGPKHYYSFRFIDAEGTLKYYASSPAMSGGGLVALLRIS
jgi:hypothetical protein